MHASSAPSCAAMALLRLDATLASVTLKPSVNPRSCLLLLGARRSATGGYNHRLQSRCKLKVYLPVEHTSRRVPRPAHLAAAPSAPKLRSPALIAAVDAIPQLRAGGFVTALRRRHRSPRSGLAGRAGVGDVCLIERGVAAIVGARRCSTSATRSWPRSSASPTPACSWSPTRSPGASATAPGSRSSRGRGALRPSLRLARPRPRRHGPRRSTAGRRCRGAPRPYPIQARGDRRPSAAAAWARG